MDSIMFGIFKKFSHSMNSKFACAHGWVREWRARVFDEHGLFIRRAHSKHVKWLSASLLAAVVLIPCSLEANTLSCWNEALEQGNGGSMLGVIGSEKVALDVEVGVAVGLKVGQFIGEGCTELFGSNGESVDSIAPIGVPVIEVEPANSNERNNYWYIYGWSAYGLLYPLVVIWLTGGFRGAGNNWRGHVKPNVM
jgi:hypothetical protein